MSAGLCKRTGSGAYPLCLDSKREGYAWLTQLIWDAGGTALVAASFSFVYSFVIHLRASVFQGFPLRIDLGTYFVQR